MAISAQQLTIYLYSAHRAVIFAIAQLSCFVCNSSRFRTHWTKCNSSSFRYENSSGGVWWKSGFRPTKLI